MDDHRRRQDPEAVLQKAEILLPLQRPHPARGVLRREVRAIQDVEQVELHPVRPLSRVAGACDHVLPGLAGDAQDQVDDDLDAPCPQGPDGLLENREFIAPAEVGGTFGMDGLQAQLHPDRLAAVQLHQEVQDLRRQAVRPGGDRQGHHLLRGHGRLK